jgi:hypothetical protein
VSAVIEIVSCDSQIFSIGAIALLVALSLRTRGSGEGVSRAMIAWSGTHG